MTEPVRGLSSMATKRLLTELGDVMNRRGPVSVQFAAAGGVEVARNIRAGAPGDLVVLSEESMSELDADGWLADGTLRALFVSNVVAAAPEGSPYLPLSTEDDLRAALVGADRIAYSTGPSGTALLDLLQRWQLANVRSKLVQAKPGHPVGTLLADGLADLGFQQRSEFADITGVRVLGPLPGAAALHSTFSGAVLTRSTNKEAAREVLRFLASAQAEDEIRAAGMSPARRGS